MRPALRISKAARADLVSTIARIARENPAAAFRFQEAVQESQERIRRWPRSGRPVDDGRFRLAPIHPFTGYLVFWEVKAGHIEIKRYFHGHFDHQRVLRTIRP